MGTAVRKPHYALAILVAWPSWGACGLAVADEWSIAPVLDWRVDHDSNRSLSVSGERSSEGSFLSIDTIMQDATETGDMTLHPRIELDRFSGDASLDSNNGSLLASLQKHNELSSFGITAEYDRASTLITELIDTGIVDSSTRRDTATGGITFGHQFSERQRLDLQANYTDVSFPGGRSVGLLGYRYPYFAATYTCGLSAAASLTASGYGDRVTAPIADYVSRDIGARFGFAYAFSERINVTASAGLSQTSIGSATRHGYVWQFLATRKGELGQWSLSQNRDVEPSGYGFLIRRDDSALSYEHGIAPNLSVTLSVHDVRNAGLTTVFPVSDDRHYFIGDGGVVWSFKQQWTLTLTAGMSEAHEPDNRTARGWRSALSIHWTPAPWSVSR